MYGKNQLMTVVAVNIHARYVKHQLKWDFLIKIFNIPG
jgi:hypothetical protein